MSSVVPYIALSIFPVAFVLGYSFNPPEFLWAVRHGFEPMPERVLAKATTFRRYANFLGHALIVGLLAVLASSNSITPARMGLHLDNWKTNVAVGIAAGLLLVAIQALLTRSTFHGPSPSFAYHASRGSVALWLLIFLSGAFSEELWIAFCIVALLATGHSVIVSIAVTAIVFAAVHYSYGFGGAVAVAFKGTASALLFLWSGSLIPMFLFHLIGNIGSLYWARCPPG